MGIKFGKKINIDTLEKEEFYNNSKQIDQVNEKMYISSLKILGIIFFILFCLSFFVGIFAETRYIYIVTLIFTGLMYLIWRVSLGGYSLWMSYILLVGYFCISYMYEVYYSEHTSILLVSAFFLIHMIITDRGWRIKLFVGVMCIISCIISLLYKDSSVCIIDISSFIGFSICGAYLGGRLKGLRLSSFYNLEILSKQKDTDQLTEMYNKRRFFQDLAEKADENAYLGVLIIDVDWFKKHNDTYGHEKGDECLKIIGKNFVKFGEENKIDFYRYGGEEFIALSTTHSTQQLREVSNKLMEMVREIAVPAEYSPYKVVTVSIGFTDGVVRNMTECENLISLADKALYRAKTVSRNTCVGYYRDKFIWIAGKLSAIFFISLQIYKIVVSY